MLLPLRLLPVLLFAALPLAAQLENGLPAGEAPPVPRPPALGASVAGAPERGPLTLDVVVTDKEGHPVSGLPQQDFSFTDNGSPSPIRSFAAPSPGGRLPEVIFVLDTVNTRFTNVAFERNQLKKYLASMADPLPPVTLVLLSDTGAKIQPQPSSSRADLIKMVDGLDVQLRFLRRDSGFYGATDRFSISLKALDQLAAYESTRAGRKLVVWISPGWPLLSGPGIDLSSSNERDFFRDVVSVAAMNERARLTLDAVDPVGAADAGTFRTFYYQAFVKPVKRAADVEIGNLSLQALAVQSGGVVLNSNNDLAKELQRCVEEDRSVYTVTLDRRPAERADDLHVIKASVEGSGLKVRTRFGYYAQP